MKTLASAIALTAAAALTATSAHAGSTAKTYYLNGYGGLAKSHTIEYSDVDITATATAYDPKTKKTYDHNVYVGQYSNGMGVTNNVYRTKRGLRSTDGSHTVDGKGYDDTLWLSFSKPFEITGAMFTYVSRRYEDVKIVDGYGDTLGYYDLSKLAYRSGYAYLDLTDLGYTGDKIGFTAYGNHDSWKVKGVKGHAVPTPSAAAAGLIGLIGLAARRRRNAEDSEG
ncbi:MAG: hypothetical protein AAGA25_07145 [Planctomycetota bacterium]